MLCLPPVELLLEEPDFVVIRLFPCCNFGGEYVSYLDSLRFAAMPESVVALTIRDQFNLSQVTSV